MKVILKKKKNNDKQEEKDTNDKTENNGKNDDIIDDGNNIELNIEEGGELVDKTTEQNVKKMLKEYGNFVDSLENKKMIEELKIKKDDKIDSNFLKKKFKILNRNKKDISDKYCVGFTILCNLLCLKGGFKFKLIDYLKSDENKENIEFFGSRYPLSRIIKLINYNKLLIIRLGLSFTEIYRLYGFGYYRIMNRMISQSDDYLTEYNMNIFIDIFCEAIKYYKDDIKDDELEEMINFLPHSESIKKNYLKTKTPKQDEKKTKKNKLGEENEKLKQDKEKIEQEKAELSKQVKAKEEVAQKEKKELLEKKKELLEKIKKYENKDNEDMNKKDKEIERLKQENEELNKKLDKDDIKDDINEKDEEIEKLKKENEKLKNKTDNDIFNEKNREIDTLKLELSRMNTTPAEMGKEKELLLEKKIKDLEDKLIEKNNNDNSGGSGGSDNSDDSEGYKKKHRDLKLMYNELVNKIDILKEKANEKIKELLSMFDGKRFTKQRKEKFKMLLDSLIKMINDKEDGENNTNNEFDINNFEDNEAQEDEEVEDNEDEDDEDEDEDDEDEDEDSKKDSIVVMPTRGERKRSRSDISETSDDIEILSPQSKKNKKEEVDEDN